MLVGMLFDRVDNREIASVKIASRAMVGCALLATALVVVTAVRLIFFPK